MAYSHESALALDPKECW